VRELAAVVFDVDGTLVDSERDGHRVAFNLAFEEFGLPDRWDVAEYGRLLATTGGQRRLHRWFSEQGMPREERDQLVPKLHHRKTELFMAMAGDGKVPARPGVGRLLDELDQAGVPVAVATTGSRAWVEPLLDRLFGLDRFHAVVTGDQAAARKPEPDAYVLAVDRLGAAAPEVVAVEDSDNGVRSARAAGMPVVAVANEYTAGQALEGAALVLDGFGEPTRPARVLRGDPALAPDGLLTLSTLRAAVRWRSFGTGGCA
jgi:HAD superfamily hydrolase (TIGR01509 family)